MVALHGAEMLLVVFSLKLRRSIFADYLHILSFAPSCSFCFHLSELEFPSDSALQNRSISVIIC